MKIADRWDIAVEEIASEMKLGDYLELYRAIEKKVLSKEVTLPTVAVGVNSLAAMWWLSIVLIGLLILIRNRVPTVLRDSNGASDEPWPILDDSVGLVRCLASTWLAAVLLSPWIVGALLLMTVAGQATADGIEQPFIIMLPRLLGLVTVPILGGWIGASLVLMLSQLRQMRATIRSSKEKGGYQ